MLNKEEIIFCKNACKNYNIDIEVCETGNLRIKGHLGYDAIHEMDQFCYKNNLVMTLGIDGVLVIHD